MFVLFNNDLIGFIIGLLDKWYDEVKHSIILNHIAKKRVKLSTQRALAMGDVQTAFYILLIGEITCLMILLIENCVQYYWKKCRRTAKR